MTQSTKCCLLANLKTWFRRNDILDGKKDLVSVLSNYTFHKDFDEMSEFSIIDFSFFHDTAMWRYG